MLTVKIFCPVRDNFFKWTHTISELVISAVIVHFFGPTDSGGWSYRLTLVSVSLSVCLCPEFFSETDHRIPQIFCIKLAYYESKKVTKPNFRKKNFWAQNLAKWAQICLNLGFLVNFSRLNHQISLILHILIDRHDIQQILVVLWLNKIFLAQIQGIQAQIWPKIRFSANILTQTHTICLILHILIYFHDI